ncbi:MULTISPECIES: DUF2780 domain-containing protein [Alteromonas]|uniref:DUF2780 domain-containing protein n=1 Tax=Alteromonas stellipolaris TaxID=233316 RepID=A0ABN4LU85_9ALTE|nr:MULTISPECIES: DUF2780 domain-containing protein [Alteromonas]AMJ91909.1 hypothetical protein AV940_16320 [Alteromonas sp. Mac2]ALM89224.1 hypothetical protein AOR13_169 [Alteromonas stellipolaris LMG 21856]AMJ75622.1 hypothetical protein AVL57_17630 [Alteromonas stellipolaris]AMJ88046.1 hypothetical protein AV939_16570 [Alteromonas sp. Mac1]ANB24877.1 hypothetical protein A6F57_06440 [Alteromonas stellipolaris]
MKILSLFVIATLSFSAHASANDTLNKLKGMLGDASTSTSQTTEAAVASSLDVSSLVSMVSENLGVSETQSEGGLASIFDYAKGNLTTADYSELASAIPGLDSLLENVPSVAADSTNGGSTISGLLSKASEYSSSLGSINELKQQFDALGLDADMISSFITQINTYLNSNEETQTLLQSGLGNLASML